MRDVNRCLFAGVAVFLWAMPGAAQAPGVRVVRDLDYVANVEYPDGKDRLDVYVPAGASNAPVIFSLHGGALSMGDRREESFVGQRFAAAGYVTVVASYRLSPQVSHPAHIQDAAAAFAWVKRHVRQHGGDPDRVLVIGHSAGAYLAMLLATDPRWLAAHGLTPRDIAGVAPVSGFFWVDKEGVAPDRPTDIWGTDRKVWVESSPARYLRADLPPVLILDTDGDEGWRQQQNADLASALRAAGHKDVTVHKVRGRSHMSVWTRMNDGPSEETSTQILLFAKRVLGPLVLSFHGRGDDAQNFQHTDLHLASPYAIVVYFQGLATRDRLAGWQVERGENNDRDLKLVDVALASLRKKYNVDDDRIYATGFSNGAMFTYLLWAECPDVFAAYAPVAGRLRPSVQPKQPRPLFHVAGQRDPQVTFADQKAPMTIAIDVNGVRDKSARRGDGCTLYGAGTPAPVMTWIHDGGHVYPRDTSRRIASFFRDHSRTR